MTGLELVTATPADAAAIAETLNHAYAGVGTVLGERPSQIRGRQATHTVMAAKVAGELVGTVTLSKGANHGELIVNRLAVHPTYQGYGYGNQIVATIAQAALTAGFTSIAGHSLNSMTTAHYVYENAGATRDPSQDIHMADGSTAHYYRLNL